MDDVALNEAIALMKTGQPPQAAYGLLVSRGVAPEEARTAIDKLVALKREAEASDPKRLREEAKWMFMQGAGVEDVVTRFAAAGISPGHGRPEAEKILAAVRAMVHCGRCRAPMAPSDTYFDQWGNRICPRCNAGEEIAASERRGLATDLEAVGIGPLVADAVISGAAVPSGPPTCPACGSVAMHVSYVHPSVRANLDPRWSYVCNHCVCAVI
jgi:hypothetical protein